MTFNGRFIAILLFFICSLCLNWPLVSIFDNSSGFGVIIYLFLFWAATIACLWAFCRNMMQSDRWQEEGDDGQ
jgi:hypothetical protein